MNIDSYVCMSAQESVRTRVCKNKSVPKIVDKRTEKCHETMQYEEECVSHMYACVYTHT